MAPTWHIFRNLTFVDNSVESDGRRLAGNRYPEAYLYDTTSQHLDYLLDARTTPSSYRAAAKWVLGGYGFRFA